MIAAGVALGLALLAAPAEASEEVRRFALLVGANDGGAGRVPLRYAHADVAAIEDVLLDLGGVAVADRTVVHEPSPAALDAAFGALVTRLEGAGERTEVVFYYSGHSDENGLLLGGERYGYDTLRARLDALPAKVRIAVLDSCASGALIRGKGGTAVAPFLVDESTAVDGAAYITSSSEDEVSQEADRIGGSYFTHALTTGLRGAADMTGDGLVTLYEAHQFAFNETLARTERSQHGPQHPSHEFQLSGAGNLVLTDLRRTEATLVLDEALVARALVRDDAGRLVAELRKEPGKAIELALEEGSYDVTLARDDGHYAIVEVDAVRGESTLLPTTGLDWRLGERAVARGDEPARSDVFRTELWPGVPAVAPGRDAVLVGATWVDTRHLSGIGLATLGVHAERLDGVASGFVWSTAGTGRGAQLGWMYNGVGGDFSGLQWSFGANRVGGHGAGAQLAPVNQAGRFDGAQLGLINLGGDVRGAQIGVLNIGRDVRGLQLGLVNVAHDVHGMPLGLLSIERQGRHDLLLYADDTDLLNLELKLGGDWLHTILGGGGTPGEHGELHAGLGGHLRMGPVWMDLDVTSSAYGDVRELGERLPTVVASGQATLGLELIQQVQPFVGVSVNAPLLWDAAEPVRLGKGDAAAWPGVLGGLAFRPILNDRPVRTERTDPG